jgi:hypothetical protein
VSNKMKTAMSTLVVALPAGLLGYFVVTSFLGNFEHLPTMYQGLYGATLAGCVVMVFLPFAVLIFGPKAPKMATATASAKPSKGEKGSDSKVVDAIEESSPELAAEGIEEETERPLSTGELDVVQPTASEAEMDAFDGFDAEDESKTESFGAFDEANLSDEQIRTPEEAHEIGAKTQSISTPDDDEFSFDDEIEPPKKKKK